MKHTHRRVRYWGMGTGRLGGWGLGVWRYRLPQLGQRRRRPALKRRDFRRIDFRRRGPPKPTPTRSRLCCPNAPAGAESRFRCAFAGVALGTARGVAARGQGAARFGSGRVRDRSVRTVLGGWWTYPPPTAPQPQPHPLSALTQAQRRYRRSLA